VTYKLLQRCGSFLSMFLQEWPQGITVDQCGGSKYLLAAYQVTKIYVFRDHIIYPEIKLHTVLTMMITEI